MKTQTTYDHFIQTNMRDSYSQRNCAHLLCFYRNLYYSSKKLSLEHEGSKDALEKKLDDLYKTTSTHFYDLQSKSSTKLSWFQKFVNMLFFRSCKKELNG